MSVSVREAYEAELVAKGFHSDPAQLRAVEALQRCADDWAAYRQRRSNAFKKLINHPEIPRGVYMYGGVGRGMQRRQLAVQPIKGFDQGRLPLAQVCSLTQGRLPIYLPIFRLWSMSCRHCNIRPAPSTVAVSDQYAIFRLLCCQPGCIFAAKQCPMGIGGKRWPMSSSWVQA